MFHSTGYTKLLVKFQDCYISLFSSQLD